MKLLRVLLVLFVLLLLGAPAHATLIINPDSGKVDETRWEGVETNNNVVKGLLQKLVGDAELLYKSDFKSTGPVEDGHLAASYVTTFSNFESPTIPDDPSNAIIRWISGTPYVGSPSYLAVKDGIKGDPAWYLFDLTKIFGWDGMETLELQNFWTEKGAISYVALYGTSTSVPEPATMLLLGFGLIGLAVVGRGNFRKN